jgi:hypothetical protein
MKLVFRGEKSDAIRKPSVIGRGPRNVLYRCGAVVAGAQAAEHQKVATASSDEGSVSPPTIEPDAEIEECT